MTCQGEHLFQHQIAWGSPPHFGFSALCRNSVVFLEVISFHFCRQVGRGMGERRTTGSQTGSHTWWWWGCWGERCSRYTTPPQMSRSLPGPTEHRTLCRWGTCS